MVLYDTVIIGSGPAGLSSAIYCSRAKLNTIVIEGDEPGGQLMTTDLVENYPGVKSITGPELMEIMNDQAKSLGCKFVDDSVDELCIEYHFGGNNKKVILKSGEELLTKSIIFSTGSTVRQLNKPGEDKTGVFSCFVCDGNFYEDKVVVVVGGGDSAATGALYLSKMCKHIYMIVRKDVFRAEKCLYDQILSNSKIQVLFESEIDTINGEKSVESVTYIKNGVKYNLVCDGVCVCIGHIPNTSLLENKKLLDENGYCKHFVDNKYIPGFFIAGDCIDYKYRQAIVAAGDGCKAALDCIEYLEKINK